jgi:hypothetical protein
MRLAKGPRLWFTTTIGERGNSGALREELCRTKRRSREIDSDARGTMVAPKLAISVGKNLEAPYRHARHPSEAFG